MKIDVCIPVSNKNNFDFMTSLLSQTYKPTNIWIVDNTGELNKNFENTTILKGIQNYRGRSRNIGIEAFLQGDSNALIFIDQDCIPTSNKFIESHINNLQNYDLCYGLRMQKYVNLVEKITLCVLYNNLGKHVDNLDDIRKTQGFAETFNNLTDPYEKALYAITETMCWSCNFSCRRELFKKGIRFDNDRIGWGYEDILFSVDAFFRYNASCIFDTTTDAYVTHIMHNTSNEDNLLYHSIEKMKVFKYLIDLKVEKFKEK